VTGYVSASWRALSIFGHAPLLFKGAPLGRGPLKQ
jgi:hypothetical protein